MLHASHLREGEGPLQSQPALGGLTPKFSLEVRGLVEAKERINLP